MITDLRKHCTLLSMKQDDYHNPLLYSPCPPNRHVFVNTEETLGILHNHICRQINFSEQSSEEEI